MGFFDFVGDALGGIGKAVGGIAKTAAPFASFIPGVGPLAGAALGAGGHLLGDALDGGDFNLGGALKAGVSSGIGGLTLGGKGFNGITSALQNGASLPGLPGGSPFITIPGGGGTPGNGLLGIPGLDIGDLLKGGAAVAGGIRGAAAESRAGGLMDEALGLARQDYASRAPMRERAQSLLMGPMPQGPDLSYLRDTANPYTRLPSPPAGGVTPGPVPPQPIGPKQPSRNGGLKSTVQQLKGAI